MQTGMALSRAYTFTKAQQCPLIKSNLIQHKINIYIPSIWIISGKIYEFVKGLIWDNLHPSFVEICLFVCLTPELNKNNQTREETRVET